MDLLFFFRPFFFFFLFPSLISTLAIRCGDCLCAEIDGRYRLINLRRTVVISSFAEKGLVCKFAISRHIYSQRCGMKGVCLRLLGFIGIGLAPTKWLFLVGQGAER